VVIAQDLYLPPFEVDIFLPAASFAEAEGTLTSIEGRVQELRSVEHFEPGAAHGFARPDWRIFADLAARLGRTDLRYSDAAAVRAAMRADLPGFAAEGDRSPRRMTPIAPDVSSLSAARPPLAVRSPLAADSAVGARSTDGPAGRGRFILVSEQPSFRHRGIDLAAVVEGLGELHLEEGLAMNPDDLARLGVEEGGTVTVTLDGGDLVRAVRSDPDCPRGAAYLTRGESWDWPTHAVRVRIRAGDRSRAARPARQASSAPRASSARQGGSARQGSSAPEARVAGGSPADERGGGRGRGR
jgi:predicted molibdopterin-dependent oxidoreductase YjgC